MNITHETLTNLHACANGVATFDKQFPNGTTLTEAVEWAIGTNNADNLKYASWLLTHLCDKTQAVRYALFAAEQVIALFEAKRPNDQHPRNAINAAKAWLDNPCDETRKSAYAAAANADAAAYAAYAADAADAAAYAAANAAANAAYAAYAAASAANAAANAAYAAASARFEMKTRILRYGITLFN